MPLLSTLLPPRCAVCGADGRSLCPRCWARLLPAPPAPPPAGLDRCRSLLAYDDAARTLLVRLKYGNERSVVGWLAAAMTALVEGWVRDLGLAAVTWAPTSSSRRRARGYDQAELLARGVGEGLGLPCRRLLVREPGPPQTGRSRAARAVGPTFTPVAGRAPPGRAVLLVDDVLTTGATLTAAAGALRAAGVVGVAAVTAARTSLKVQTGSVDA